MSQYQPESLETAKLRRQQQAGAVDFAAMYADHDSFTADVEALIKAAQADQPLSTDAVAVWERFSQQLHNHHTAEDELLWPSVRAVADSSGIALLDQMESEHQALDETISLLTDLYKNEVAVEILPVLETLQPLLGEHLFNEELHALPLIERTIGAEGWPAYGHAVRARATTR